jgi:hypothetical protein
MATDPKYFYSAPATATAVSDGALKEKSSAEVNTVLRFDNDFLNSLQSINPTDLGTAVPYISLKTINPDTGDLFEDLNVNYFFKAADMDAVFDKPKYGERPIMSLVSLEIKTDLPSGYIYYQNVTLRVKIHSPDFLRSAAAVALTIPGMPLVLEYGWNCPANEFLNEKAAVLFQVKTYNLSMDETGQIDLTVEGMALNETFTNVYVGDTGEDVGSDLVDGRQGDSVSNKKERLENAQRYLSRLRDNPGSNDPKVLKDLATSVTSAENKIRGKISKSLNASVKKVRQIVTATAQSNKHKKDNQEVIQFHDLVWAFCHDTFKGMTDIFPGIDDFEVVYGNFNEKAGQQKNKSIAEFPIKKRRFLNRLRKQREKGAFTPTVGIFLNDLVSEFLENSSYWTPLMADGEEFDKPDIVINFTTRIEGDKKILVLNFLDIHNGVPPTTSAIGDRSEITEAEFEGLATENDIPIFKLGHANSFIKKITMTQIIDQYMKAALIERMARNRVESPRSVLTQSQSLQIKGATPLTLPLQGTASVLGHVKWLPFKTFFLSAGIFVVSGFYKIKSVRHMLSAEGFNTDIEFFYH